MYVDWEEVVTTFGRLAVREFEVEVEDRESDDERHDEELFVLPELVLLLFDDGPVLLVKLGESSLIGGVGMP